LGAAKGLPQRLKAVFLEAFSQAWMPAPPSGGRDSWNLREMPPGGAKRLFFHGFVTLVAWPEDTLISK
jgi:hypothetical protein